MLIPIKASSRLVSLLDSADNKRKLISYIYIYNPLGGTSILQKIPAFSALVDFFATPKSQLAKSIPAGYTFAMRSFGKSVPSLSVRLFNGVNKKPEIVARP